MTSNIISEFTRPRHSFSLGVSDRPKRFDANSDTTFRYARRASSIDIVIVSVELLFYAEMNSLFLRCCQAPERKAWRRNHMISGCWRTGASLVGGPARSK